MTASTRDQFIAVAERRFAERGFYGASIAAIATELGLTKQALLHHFGSKEKLYGEVLRRISDELNAQIRRIADAGTDPAQQLEEMVVAQYRAQIADQDRARLIMRELLDNEQRAAKAGSWYLRPYLERLVDTVRALAPGHAPQRGEALALVYQLLGAAHYFAVSQPTLQEMFGQDWLHETRECFEMELRTLVRARLQEVARR
ncbi:MAG: TetR family transcriptional regulator [Halioglobus sp.]|nr:TetR family transcriptional regulator [Halioglobus sp.]|tara:strand:- start:1993 stop:2598 length:606 start_codon:yes stop_codon:yes gene_type:complete